MPLFKHVYLGWATLQQQTTSAGDCAYPQQQTTAFGVSLHKQTTAFGVSLHKQTTAIGAYRWGDRPVPEERTTEALLTAVYFCYLPKQCHNTSVVSSVSDPDPNPVMANNKFLDLKSWMLPPTNVPQTFRYLIIRKPNRLSSFPNLSYRDHFYLVQESRFWTKSKQSIFNKTNSGTTYQNVLVLF